MTAAQLLRLYPRHWRERYGDEFLDVVGPGPLRLQQVIDIVSGAIDARLSSDVRGVTREAATHTGGPAMVRMIAVCPANRTRYSKRDGLVGAAIMIVGTAVLTLIATLLQRSGFTDSGAVVLNSGALIAFMLSLPFWMMKGQPRTAQSVVIGGTIAGLLLINIIAVAVN